MDLKGLAAPWPSEGVDVAEEQIAVRVGILTNATGRLERVGLDGVDHATRVRGEHDLIISQGPAW